MHLVKAKHSYCTVIELGTTDTESGRHLYSTVVYMSPSRSGSRDLRDIELDGWTEGSDELEPHLAWSVCVLDGLIVDLHRRLEDD